MGGGILLFTILVAIPLNLNAIELSTICTNPNNCKITTPQSEVTNHGTFTSSNLIEIEAPVTRFINYGTITNGIYTGYNYALGTITNYGEMHGLWAYKEQNITIDNRGVMKTALGNYMSYQNNTPAHFMFEDGNSTLTIENYTIKIIENTSEFNNFSGYNSRTNNKNSHLIVWEHGNTLRFVKFKDKNSKLILDFGNGFEFGTAYKINKLVTNQSGTPSSNFHIDFSRLTTRSELYTLTQSGDNFVVNVADSKAAGYSVIGSLHKSNIKTMNNFWTLSNAMIYPHKFAKKRVIKKKRVIRKKVVSLRHSEPLGEESMNLNNALDSSLISFNQNDSFFYKNDSNNTTNRTKTRRRITTTNRTLSNQSNDKYYFVLTPFVAHNYFFEAGRYNLSGLEYGFITAFSGKITEDNILGLHFAFSYGSLKDSVDSIFNITAMNIMGGLNYKFDMTSDMYLKARVDIFYFLNQAQSTATSGNIIKPNNLGFGASVAYGKEWDFDRNGILGLEVALDYKGLMSPNILTQNGGDSTINESFNKALYNMLYVDLGLNYDKYFESNIGKWGLDTGLGVKVNATANALAKSTIRLNNIRDIDMVLDNDMFLAYLNIGGSYLLESKDFDMEFSLAYYGNFGDRTISNGGGFEWRVYW